MTRHRSNRALFGIATVSWLLAITPIFAAVSDAATRVAIIPTGLGPSIKNIAAVAEAELSGDSNFVVLERQQIDRVLSEQKLSLMGAVDPSAVIQVGKVLSTDLLILLEADSSQFGIVIFDPASGVQLWNAAAKSSKGEEAASEIIAGIKAAAAKRADVVHRKTVCILAVRNGDLSRDFDGVCDAVGQLAQRAMVSSPSVVMLERSRLDQVTRERAIAADASTRDLLASLVTVDLEIDRGAADGGLKAIALLSDSASHPLGKVVVESRDQDAAALASLLVASLNQNMKTPAPAPFDNRAEASRFCNEALFRLRNSDFARSVAPAEAAHALVPDDLSYRAVLTHCLIDAGWQLFRIPDGGFQHAHGGWEDHSVAPPSVLRGAKMLAAIPAAQAPADGGPAKVAHEQYLDSLATLRRLVTQANFFHEREPLTTNDIPELQASLRRILMDDAARRSMAVHDERSFNDYSDYVADLVTDNQHLFSSSASQWASDLRRISSDWLMLKQKTGASASFVTLRVLERIGIGWQFKGFLNPGFHGLVGMPWPVDSNELADISAVRQLISSNPDPVVRRYDALISFSIALSQRPQTPESLRDAAGQFISLIEGDLKNMPSPLERHAAFRMMICADALLDRSPYDSRFSEKIAETMFQRHELLRLVIDRAIRRQMNEELPAQENRRVRILEAAKKVAAAPDCVVLEEEKTPRTKRWVEAGFRDPMPGAQPGLVKVDGNWYGSRRLLDLAEVTTPTQCIYQPIVDGNAIYALAAIDPGDEQPYRMRLVKIAMAGGAPKTIGELQSAFNYRSVNEIERRDAVAGLVTSAYLADGYYAAAMSGQGTMLFPIAGGDAVQLDSSNGMPAQFANGVAILNGAVYISLGVKNKATYIASYDLATRQIKVVVSSVRKDKQSPFDDGSAFEVVSLLADKPRNRLIVTIVRRDDPPSTITGMWEYKPATQTWRQLVPMKLYLKRSENRMSGSLTMVDGVRRAGENELLVKASGALYVYDLPTDQARTLFQAEIDEPVLPRDTPRLTRVGNPFGPALESLERQNPFPALTPFSNLRGDWFWTPVGRISLRDGSTQIFENPRQRDRDRMNFVFPLDDGRLLLGDSWGLVLVDPRPGHAATHEKLTSFAPAN